MSMKVMLLGATGFVGANVLPELLKAGIEVIVVGRKKPTDHLPQGVVWVAFDDVHRNPVKGIDALMSFAGVGSPAVFEATPEESCAAELGIADLIAQLSGRHGVRNVVYLSTAGAAYGEGLRDGQVHSFRESDSCDPVSAYGRIKVAAEAHLALRLEQALPGVPLTVLRASNIYGLRYAKAGQQGLVNALVERARTRQPVTVYGDGLIYRDYLFASDLASALLAALAHPLNGVVNIGFGRSHSIIEVISAVEAETNFKFERLSAPARSFDVKYSVLSIEKARQQLRWEPRVDLATGVRMLFNQGL